jgi:hypothetical protein
LSAENVPDGAQFVSTNENGIFIWNSAGPAGVYTTRFFAADNDGTNSESVVITISDQVAASTNAVVKYIFETAGPVFTRAAESVLPGVSASLFEAGDGVSTNSTGNPNFAILDSGFTGTTNNWFQFTLTIPANSTVNVSRIKFDDRRSNTGPSAWAVRSSLDNFASDLASGVGHLSFTTNEASITPGPLTGSVTFRIYGANGTAGGTWRLDNVELVGSEVPAAADSPSITVTTATQSVSNPTTSISVGGTANTNVVGDIRWTNSLTGGSGTIPAATSWLISSVPLNVGANVITVTGTNSSGASASGNVTITRASASGGGGCTNILFQGFEPGDNWTILNGAAQITNVTGSGDVPPNQRIRSGSFSWQSVGSGNRTLTLDSVSMSGYTGRQVSARLSATSLTAGNGVESGDFAKFFVALDGAAFPVLPEINLNGGTTTTNNNRWGFWATNVLITTAGTAISNTAPGSFTSTNSYANFFINIPDGATSIALRVNVNSGANEVWNLDDIALTGCSAGGAPDTTPILVITTAPQTVVFAVTNLPVGGTSSNLSGVIRWTNSLSGGSGSIAAAANWLISDIALSVGTNAITVSGTNSSGVATSAVVSIIRNSNDTDGDGIDDQWELDNFGSLTNANSTSDFDLDGVIDLHEFLSGTQPTNGLSYLHVANSALAPANGVVIQWVGVNGKNYSLSRNTNLLDYIYTIIKSNIAGVEPFTVYTDPAPPEVKANYRIELEK